ncbi:MAG TPA: hypothetical protein VKJ45_05915 [Blastocatellia bacterium]|nr:hypothetical protein [Blastocatellia bacterium]
MNKQTMPFIGENRKGVIVDELLSATECIGAAVIVGVITEPKIPPLVGD